MLLVLVLFGTKVAIAQLSKQQSIEESQPGWTKVYRFKGAKEIKKVDDRIFSIAQLSICDSLANWMQASYLPKAGIGDIRKTVFPAVNQYSPFNVAWPQGYGAVAYTWDVKYNSAGKLEKIPESEVGWGVEANAVPGWPIRDLSTTTRYYFTMPSFNSEDMRKQQDLSTVESLKPYITFWIKNIEAGGGTEYVLLCKDNKSPFLKVTKGEYLQLLEEAIPRAYEKEKRSIHEKNKGNQKSIDYFMKYLDEKQAKRLTCLKNNKEKYKNRLTETTETFSSQPDIMLENFPDVFEGEGGSAYKYPVYTIDPAMFELCKKDKPQWILASWSWTPASVMEKHMHESIINNFNFDYVYNFFFDPAKVKGQPYRPKRSPVAKEVLVAADKSAASKKAMSDQGVHYFEDFSTTPVGKKPMEWYAKNNSAGSTAVVATVDGFENKWALLAGHTMSPNSMKKPLPKNFTLSYEMMVPEKFTWGAKGLVLLLSKEKSEGVDEYFVRLKIRPGFDGRDGEVELETKCPSGYSNGTKWYAATGFSNNKKMNRIQVDLNKTGEVLRLMIDKKVIAEYTKGLPDDLSFNALSFSMANVGEENDKYYVTNIKITNN